MENWFRKLFKTDPPLPARDKFLARVHGIFSEEIVRIWCDSGRSPYENLGRPYVATPKTKKPVTLDFMLRSRQDGRCYVTEMKCWLEYKQYRHLTLVTADQLDDAWNDAFEAFLYAALYPKRCKVTVSSRPCPVGGAILIWGDVTDGGRTSVMKQHGVVEVLSLRGIVGDLVKWKDERYVSFLGDRRRWCDELFDRLAAAGA